MPNDNYLSSRAIEVSESKMATELAKAAVVIRDKEMIVTESKWDNFEQSIYRYVKNVPSLTY